MRHPHLLVAIGLMALVIVACTSPSATVTDAGSASPEASATPVASASGDATAAPTAAATTEPIPSDELGPFTCDLPLHENATIARALVNDVRTGTHDGYDRVVFEFLDGLPEASLERAEPPFAEDGSGFPIDVQGDSFLRLIMRGGTVQTEEGTVSYDGPTEFETGFPALVHLIEGGDFEAQSTWYFGLNAESCVRVLTLTDDGTARLVFDIEH